MVNGVLMIHSVNQSDAGMYQCLAENKYGAIYASAELKILGMQFLNKSVGEKCGFFPCSNSHFTKVLWCDCKSLFFGLKKKNTMSC